MHYGEVAATACDRSGGADRIADASAVPACPAGARCAAGDRARGRVLLQGDEGIAAAQMGLQW